METTIGTLNIRRAKMDHLLRTITGIMGLCLLISGCATYEPAQKGYKLRVTGSTALNRGTLLLFGPAVAKPSKQKVEEIPPQ